MFKKSIFFVLVLSLVFSISAIAFGQDDEITEYVDIINPEVSESGNVISNKSLYISIYVKEEVDLIFQLVKVSTPVFIFESEKDQYDSQVEEIVYDELETVISNENDDTGVINEEVSEEISEVDNSITEEILLDHDIENINDNIDTDKVLSKEEVYEYYTLANEKYEMLNIKYKEISEKQEVPSESDDQSMNQSTDEVFIDEIEAKLKEANKAQKYWHSEWIKYFETVVVEADMVVDSSLPYFNYTVDDIEHGKYKMFVKLKTTNTVVKQLEFDIISEDTLADVISQSVVEDKMLDNVLDSIDLLNEGNDEE